MTSSSTVVAPLAHTARRAVCCVALLIAATAAPLTARAQDAPAPDAPAPDAPAPDAPAPDAPTDPIPTGDLDTGDLDTGDLESGDLDDVELDDLDPETTTDGGDITVTAPLQRMGTVGGSARRLTEADLEAMEHDDPHSILTQVTGLYVRQEDGFGLRPNIGLRGANSDRSKKVTLMEDGILFGPAPYAAPAAYFFPLMTRMVGVEVYKGPGAILYGPNTIGGAVNLLTRPVPLDTEAALDAGYGMFGNAKAHAYVGKGWRFGGLVLEGVRLQSDGFKTVDNHTDDPTGFARNEAMLKALVNTSLDAYAYHSLELKLGYSSERSHETYLGLSDADYAADPYRRYAASALDRMDWWRTQGQLAYKVELGDDASLALTLYRHDFDRAWLKLNRFSDGTPISDILADPTNPRRRVYYDVLTGAEDATPAETLGIGTNARTFVSQGAQLTARHHLRADDGAWSNNAELGLRLHYDRVARHHTEGGFLMQDGSPVRDDSPLLTTTRNAGNAQALALHLIDQATWGRVTLAPGLRVERIETDFRDALIDLSQQTTQTVVLPGLGAHVAITEHFGLLGGAHRGFSPVSPGQPDGTLPEFSVNYEAGGRYATPDDASIVELIGFWSDYSNLTGACSFSAGCDDAQLDREFNAGRADVYGLEAMASHDLRLPPLAGLPLMLPLRLAYTYTHAEFQDAFSSDNPQFGDVAPGDALPYIPQHQASVGLGVESTFGGLNASFTYVSAMRERAGQSPDDLMTDPQALLDLKAHASPLPWLSVYAKLDNALGATPVVSRLPFGARPTRPLLLFGGLKVTYERLNAPTDDDDP